MVKVEDSYVTPTHPLSFAVHKNRFDRDSSCKQGWKVVYVCENQLSEAP
jgi:hypothetical protein